MAKILFSKAEIDALVQEQKPVSSDSQHNLRLNLGRRYKTKDFDITGERGNKFKVILRQSIRNVLDFSIILAVFSSHSHQLFRLRRYNGKSHEHTNRIEDKTFYEFHIHVATERYQNSGGREDTYAEPTDRYNDYEGALCCFIEDGNLKPSHDGQRSLFGRPDDVH